MRPSADDHSTETLNFASGLLAVARMVRRQKWLFLTGLSIGLATAGAYAWLTTPTYESLTEILVIKKTPTLPAHGTDSQSHLEQPVDDDLLATHMLILQSPRVVNDALARLEPAHVKSITAALGPDEDAAEYLMDRLRVTRGGEGQERAAHVIAVQLSHTSPVHCQAILNAIVDSYNNFLRTTLLSPVDEALALISQARDEIASELHDVRAEYSEFRQRAPLLWNRDGSLNLHQARLEKLDSALSDIRVAKVNAESRLRTALELVRNGAKRESTPLRSVAWNPEFGASAAQLPAQLPFSAAKYPGPPEQAESVKTEFNQLLELYLQQGELLASYGADHPEVVQVGASIKRVEEFLTTRQEALTNVWLGGLRADWLDLQNRERQLSQILDSEQNATKSIIRAQLKDESLRNDLDRHQQLFDAVVERLASIHLAKDYGGFSTEVIAPAKVGKKTHPRLGLLLSLGTVLGIIVGLSMSALADQMRYPFAPTS